MVEIVTNRAEVAEEIIARVKQATPNASIVPGTPVYDLLVTRLAGIIADERELVNVATNIARVAPMFGDDGKLLPEFSDMADYLTDRFFLTRPESSEIYDTVYLRFTNRTGVRILAKSELWYGTLRLQLAPTYITEDSPLWKVEVYNGYFTYTHPVDVATRIDTAVTIPATEEWVTGGVQVESKDPVVVLGAVSRKAINTTAEPEVTFDYLKYSISNRSLSNTRAILYNLRTNLGFNPDQLIKARVMHTMEPCFIERRKILYNDEILGGVSDDASLGRTDSAGFRLMTAVVSGDGKIMLDYGTGLYKAPVDAVHIDRSDPLYSELNPLIKDDDPAGAVTELNLEGARELTGKVTLTPLAPSEEQDTDVVTHVEVTVHVTEPEEAYYTGEEDIQGRFARIWLYKDSEEETVYDPSGWVSLDCDIDRFTQETESDSVTWSAEFRYHRDNYMLFRIDTSGLGLLSPVSIGTESDMDALTETLTSVDPDELIPSGTCASVAYPGSTLVVHGNVQNGSRLFSNVDFTMRRPSDGTALNNNLLLPGGGPLYWKVLRKQGIPGVRYIVLSTDPEFKDRDKGLGAVEVSDNSSSSGTVTRQLRLSSDITLTLTFDIAVLFAWNVNLQKSAEQYFHPAAGFIRNSNRYLVYAVNPAGTVSDENVKAWLLYYGTDPDLMTRAQELYLNGQFMEVGNRIIVSPFRPMVFTAYWGADYVTQFIPESKADDDPERYDTVRSQFIDLQAWLEDWFSSYAGDISDIDFAEVAAGGQQATGLVIKRLDWTLFTQRGYAVRGVLDINLDHTCRIDWQKDVVDVVESSVGFNRAFVTEERESAVTDESLYRPLFSRVAP